MILTTKQEACRLHLGKGVVRSVHMDDDLATPCSCILETSLSSVLSPVKYLKSLGNIAHRGFCTLRGLTPVNACEGKR